MKLDFNIDADEIVGSIQRMINEKFDELIKCRINEKIDLLFYDPKSASAWDRSKYHYKTDPDKSMFTNMILNAFLTKMPEIDTMIENYLSQKFDERVNQTLDNMTEHFTKAKAVRILKNQFVQTEK